MWFAPVFASPVHCICWFMEFGWDFQNRQVTSSLGGLPFKPLIYYVSPSRHLLQLFTICSLSIIIGPSYDHVFLSNSLMHCSRFFRRHVYLLVCLFFVSSVSRQNSNGFGYSRNSLVFTFGTIFVSAEIEVCMFEAQKCVKCYLFERFECFLRRFLLFQSRVLSGWFLRCAHAIVCVRSFWYTFICGLNVLH